MARDQRRSFRRFWSFLRITTEFSLTAGSLAYMAAFLFSAVLGIIRQVLFNAHFGVGLEASAYYAAFRLPETIGTLIAGGTLTNALVPVLLRVRRAAGDAAAARLVGLTLGVLLAIFAPLTLLCLLLAPLFVRYLLAPGFDAATAALTVELTRLMLLEVLLIVTESVLVAQLTSRNQLLLPVVAIALRNLTLIGGILAAIFIPGVGIYGPTIGAIGDALLQLLLILAGLRGELYKLRPRWGWADRNLRMVLRLLVPNGLSALVNYGGGIVDTAFATLAREAAALPALFNAFLLFGLPVRLIGVAIGQAVLPHLAAHHAAGNRPAMGRDLRRALLAAAGLSLAATVALVALGRPTIRLLFERGRFDSAAGDLTYSMLAAFAFCLPAMVLTEVITRALITLYDTRTPLLTNLLQLGLRIAMLIPLTPALGVIAIPIVSVVTTILETLALAWVLRVRLSDS